MCTCTYTQADLSLSLSLSLTHIHSHIRAYTQIPEAPVEIRGCCFKHTALTEQHMSTIVSDILSKFNIPVGNRPVGLWHYQQLLGEPLPRIAKYCGLFETLGEKRVGSHLLPGLESLLPLLFPSISLDQVLSLCPAQRLAADANTRWALREISCSSSCVEF